MAGMATRLRWLLNTRGAIIMLLIVQAIWRVFDKGDTAQSAPGAAATVWNWLWQSSDGIGAFITVLVLCTAWIAYLIIRPAWGSKALRWIFLGSDKDERFRADVIGRLDAAKAAIDSLQASVKTLSEDKPRWEHLEKNHSELRDRFDKIMPWGALLQQLSPIDTTADNPLYDIRIDLQTRPRLVADAIQSAVRTEFTVTNGTNYPVRLTGRMSGNLRLNARAILGLLPTITEIEIKSKQKENFILDFPLTTPQQELLRRETVRVDFNSLFVEIIARRDAKSVWHALGWRQVQADDDIHH